MTKYYPMMVNIENKKCLVVGGGNVAYRKLNELIEYGSKVTLISRELNENLDSLVKANDKSIIYIKDSYKKEYIDGAFMVIAATNDSEINFKIAKDCEGENIPVNVVDDPYGSSFIVPAKVKRGDLTILISTNGKCPFYTKFLRKRLETQFDDSYCTILNILGDFRKDIIQNIKSSSKRKDIIASIDIEYYIKRLKEIGDKEVRKEIDEYWRAKL